MPIPAPRFWYQRRLSPQAAALLPFAWLYRLGLHLHHRSIRPVRLPVPVISVGNITLGGTGKTPLVIALARALSAQGFAVAVLLRGYGRQGKEPLLVQASMAYQAVGDEALEYAQQLPGVQVWVGSNRTCSAHLAIDNGANLLLLDDGLQHWPLQRNLDLTLLDRRHGVGNGQVFPAGPLREPLGQLARADILVLTGPAPAGPMDRRIRYHWPVKKPSFELTYQLEVPADLFGRQLWAFCGIGLPRKFFEALGAAGLKLLATESFADHHAYSEQELARLLAVAQAHDALLVTTVKDAQRLPAAYRSSVRAIPMRLETGALDALVAQILERIGNG
ncbi:tetraacyldisaccharide 4'-kinase [Cyanobium sp. HWJ4-Hawea]|uniref:tetraacyldisaccharide 4'-kinase n=1 Tax=Cyanobium sp. HWJ4-Hawea TaxID=2823713 RepID=UPI0020CF519C|nr:tetraacyldisaccharide 4'-kinase [Cyanobium sp. HWJ4-Hawea]MCP9808382.1 tetraacyldisaccharide 4'-kinase [Cyanobium sp. HWJ4-Hawea]